MKNGITVNGEVETTFSHNGKTIEVLKIFGRLRLVDPQTNRSIDNRGFDSIATIRNAGYAI